MANIAVIWTLWAFVLIFSTKIAAGQESSSTGDCVWYGAEGEIAEGAYVYCQDFRFSRYAMATAHYNVPIMKCGTKIRVMNLANNKTVDVTVTDKGPNHDTGRILDLTWAAFGQIADHGTGVIKCSYTLVTSNDLY